MTRTTIEKDNGRGRGRGKAVPIVSNAEEVKRDFTKFTQTPEAEEAKIKATGQEDFKRIATGRVNAIVGKLNTLAKLVSGKSRYGYSDEDIERIRKHLIEAVNSACDRLLRKPPAKGGFSFDRPHAGA